MQARWIAGVTLALLGASGATADRVLLTNGEVFENVIAKPGEARLTILIASGELSLPNHLVLRVEREESGLERYLERSRVLARDPEASASSWLDLARWARANEVPHGVREAALRAAELDPGVEGLAPIMRSLGYVRDQEADLWIVYRRESPKESPRPPRPASESAPQEPSVAQHLARAVEALAVAQAERRESAPQPGVVMPIVQPVPVVAVAAWGFVPAAAAPAAPGSDSASQPTQGLLFEELVRRQPGSLLPFPRPYRGAPPVRRRGY